MIEQPTMRQMVPRKHYFFPVGSSQKWHLIQDDSGLIFILISNVDYKDNGAYSCLEELQRQFTEMIPEEKALAAREGALSSTCRDLLTKIVNKYDDVRNVDQVSVVQRKVDKVQFQMQENIDQALSNCVKLEQIEKQSEDLQREAGVFRKGATDLKNKVRWEEIRLKLCIAFFVLAVLGAVIGVAVYMSEQTKKASQTASSDSSDNNSS